MLEIRADPRCCPICVQFLLGSDGDLVYDALRMGVFWVDLTYIDRPLFQKMLGIYIRESRERMGLNQQDLKKLCSISIYRLQQIENGEVFPRQNTLALLMSTLNLSEARLERIAQVARIRFIDELMGLMWSSSSEEMHATP